MDVCGLSGSTRLHGNTAALVNVVLDRCNAGGLTTNFVSLAGKEIQPCTGCEFCTTEHRCVLEDDWEEVADRIIEAQVLVVGGPVYFYEVCGHLKNFIDRTYSLYHDKRLTGRHGVAIAVHADKGADRAIETLEAFMSTHQFTSLGSVIGRGFKAGEVLSDTKAVREAEKLGDSIVRLLRPED
jgi:multimeric flavodoxin WrbA